MNHQNHINTLSTRIDNDKLNLLGRERVATQAHLALNGIQKQSPELQLLAVATLFAVFVERSSVRPEDLYLKGKRVLYASGGGDTKTDDSLESLRDFAKLRVRNGVVSHE